MEKIFYGKFTIIFFLAFYFIAQFIKDSVFATMGHAEKGFPFIYAWYESEFIPREWHNYWLLVLNIVLFYAFSVLISFIVHKFKEAKNHNG